MSDTRSDVYTAKTNPATVALLVAATLPGQRHNFADPRGMSSLTSLEQQAQGFLNATTPAIPTILYPSYLSFCRQLWSLRRRGITSTALLLAATGIKESWKERGLQNLTLSALTRELFGLDIKENNLRTTFAISCDFLNLADNLYPWNFDPVNGGTLIGNFSSGPTPNHPGLHRFRRAAGATSGASIDCGLNPFVLGGSESTDFILKFAYLANLKGTWGFQDNLNSIIPVVNGAYFSIDTVSAIPGTIQGHTAKTAISDTATTYVISPAVFYRFEISLNDAGTIVTFKIQNDAGLTLWQDSLTTNIPVNDDTKPTSQGMILYDTAGGSGITIAYIDFTSIYIARPLIR